MQRARFTDRYGETATFTYGTSQVGGRWAVSSIALPNGETVSYTYASNKLSQVDLPDGTQSTFTWGNNSTAQLDTLTIFDAAAEGSHRSKTVFFKQLVSEANTGLIGSSNGITRLVLNGAGEVAYANFPRPNVHTHQYFVYEGPKKLKITHAWFSGTGQHYDNWTLDGNGELISGTAETAYHQLTFNGQAEFDTGTPSAVTDPNGRARTFTYDSDGFPTQISYADSTTEKFTYSTKKQVTRYKDRLGRVTKYTYDSQGNMTLKEVGLTDNGMGGETQTAEYATYEWEYYPSNDTNKYLLKTYTDPNGNDTDYEYDSAHRLIAITHPPDAAMGTRGETTYSYDSAGRVSSVIGPGGWGQSFTYDDNSRLVKIDHADNSTERFIYGTATSANLLLKYKDRAGVVTKYEYDSAGRRNKTILAYATMDTSDNETLITDVAVKTEETTAYLTGTELPSSIVRSGDKTEYTYDFHQRVVETKRKPKSSTTLTTTNTYVDNKLFKTEDPYGRKTFNAYNTSDARLIRSIVGTVPSVTYAAFSNVLSATRAAENAENPTSLITDYTLDAEGQQTKLTDPRGVEHTSTLGNGLSVTTSYVTNESLVSSIVNATVGTYSYTWDANHNKTAETISGSLSGKGFSVPSGGYDDEDRLTAWNRSDSALNQSWSLSAVGNWSSFTENGTTVNRTHGNAHELTVIGANSLTYDTKGNLTQDDTARTYVWDMDNMLSSTTKGGTTVSYAYDALGRRTSRTAGGSTTVYVSDDHTLLAEYTSGSATNSPLRKYICASYVDEPVLLIDRTAFGSVGAGSDERLYYHRNQQFSITALSDNTGTVVERYAYTPYGLATILNAAGTSTLSTSAYGNITLFTGRPNEPGADLYDFRLRSYSPRLGRFLQRDPLNYVDSPSLYAYASGKPLVMTDPAGGCGRTPTLPRGCVTPTHGDDKSIFWRQPPVGGWDDGDNDIDECYNDCDDCNVTAQGTVRTIQCQNCCTACQDYHRKVVCPKVGGPMDQGACYSSADKSRNDCSNDTCENQVPKPARCDPWKGWSPWDPLPLPKAY